ncbi:hypothetical protein [Sphingobacterium sp. T2]|uniref:hypothetical protein n=1 Tax=Sphingobacterium sp. T2 TaxID=1590596 RepID=UPI000AAF19D6|nr:hypothetical protein [Sphingobacterium sp. T2]
MRRLAYLALMAGTLTFAACSNNPSKDRNNDGEVSAGEHLDHAHDQMDEAAHQAYHEAEDNYNKAKAELDAAIKKGDKNAEEAARKALADAEAAWEKTKANLKEAGDKVEEGFNDAVDDYKRC